MRILPSKSIFFSRFTRLASGGFLTGHFFPGEYGIDKTANILNFGTVDDVTEESLALAAQEDWQTSCVDVESAGSGEVSPIQSQSPKESTFRPWPGRLTELDEFSDSTSPSVSGIRTPPRGLSRTHTDSPADFFAAEVVFDLDQKHRFRDFRPATFRTLRILCGIDENWYLKQLSEAGKEQLTEGASNAFLFFTGDLIVKTVTADEAATLLDILDKYRDHINEMPDSLLVRFLGLHAVTIYGTEFIFVVMRNIFPRDVVVNERYDIKGSWINRNASVPPPGKRKMCRHCSELFVVGSDSRCPKIVGTHEANVVFKVCCVE